MFARKRLLARFASAASRSAPSDCRRSSSARWISATRLRVLSSTSLCSAV